MVCASTASGVEHIAALAIGCSAGGLEALRVLLHGLSDTTPIVILVVQHLHPDAGVFLPRMLDRLGSMPFYQAEDGMAITPGHGYVAPPQYHLLVEPDRSRLALNTDPLILHARPAIDPLMESVADAWGRCAAGMVLTGASQDGTAGLSRIAACGGWTGVQNPQEAEHDLMPRSAMACHPEMVAHLQELRLQLTAMGHQSS